MAIQICLDAGHYGKYNRSPVVPEYYESDMTWKLHLLQKAELEKYGFAVRLTREDKDTDMALEARGRAAEGCDFFLSDHSNAADRPAVDYVLAIHMVDDGCGEIDGRSRELAGLLADCVAGIMGAEAKAWTVSSAHDRDGNGCPDDYYGVLRGAHSVGTAGVILEHGFHTNGVQAAWLLKDGNLQKLAQAEAKVIADWFGMEKADRWYRVRRSWTDAASQTGAFRVLENAIAACAHGCTVYDWNGKALWPEAYRPSVLEWQKAAIADGFLFPEYGADGVWGGECQDVALNAVIRKRPQPRYPNLTRLVQRAVGLTGKAVDGICGSQTEACITAYQQRQQLKNVDGQCGIFTWRRILGVS